MPLFRHLFIALALLFFATPAWCDTNEPTPDILTRMSEVWTEDLPDIIKHKRPIRILVSYNRTNFFLVNGAMRGLEHDLMQAYQKYMAKQYPKQVVRIVFIAVPFDRLIPSLLEGRGDIVAAGLTATAKRKRQVPFSNPYRTNVDELIVGSPKAAPINTLDDLSGKKVHVLSGSSYEAHLLDLNKTLQNKGLKPVQVMAADDNLVTENLLEMAQSGIIEYTVADAHIADIWKTALPNLQLFTKAPLRTGGSLAWAVRPGNTALLKSLNGFARTVREGTLMGNMTFNRYYKNTDWVMNPEARKNTDNLRKMQAIFQKYGKEYDVDWIKLVALGFQESRLQMKTKSNKGAVGVMQVLPSTAKGKAVNIKNYDTLDGNIHAGTKYLRFLMDNYFKDVAPDARVDFALASYNAGPYRVLGLQKTAKQMGLDPNLWFGNVEYAAYRKIGRETPTYVANVQMYYAAFKSIYLTLEDRQKAK